MRVRVRVRVRVCITRPAIWLDSSALLESARSTYRVRVRVRVRVRARVGVRLGVRVKGSTRHLLLEAARRERHASVGVQRPAAAQLTRVGHPSQPEARHTRGRGEAAVHRSGGGDRLPLLLSEAVEPPPWRERVSRRLLLLLTDRLPLLRAERVEAASGCRRVRVGLDALLLICLARDRALLDPLRVRLRRRRLSVLPEHLGFTSGWSAV